MTIQRITFFTHVVNTLRGFCQGTGAANRGIYL